MFVELLSATVLADGPINGSFKYIQPHCKTSKVPFRNNLRIQKMGYRRLIVDL